MVLERPISGLAEPAHVGSDDLLFNGIAGDGTAGGDPQLAADRSQVPVDGAGYLSNPPAPSGL
jgi:hypothetical protein